MNMQEYFSNSLSANIILRKSHLNIIVDQLLIAW